MDGKEECRKSFSKIEAAQKATPEGVEESTHSKKRAQQTLYLDPKELNA